MKIFPEKLFMKIAMESNIYAANNNHSNFKLTVNELKTYLVLNISITYYLRYPQLKYLLCFIIVKCKHILYIIYLFVYSQVL